MQHEFFKNVTLPYATFKITHDFYDLDESLMTDKRLYWDMDSMISRGDEPRKARIWVVYPKDIQVIYGMGPAHARQLLHAIREHLELCSCSAVIIPDFITYTGLDSKTVWSFFMES